MQSLQSLHSSLRQQSVTRIAVTLGISVAAAALLVKWLRGSSSSSTRRYRDPPGPRGSPLIGNLSMASAKGSDVMFNIADKLFDEFGGVVKITVGSAPLILILRSDLVQEALLSKQLTDRVTPFFSMLYVSEGLNDIFASENNERWRFHRKSSFAAFRMFAQTERLESLIIDSFDAICDAFCDTDQHQDIYEKLFLLMYNLQCRLTFSKEFTATDAEFSLLRDRFEAIQQAMVDGLLADVLPFLKYLPHKATQEFITACDDIQNWMRDLCSARKKEFNSSELNDMLDFLIKEQILAVEQGKGHLFEDVHLRQTLLNIFGAGTSTSGHTLYWLVMALSRNASMQERCYAEIASVFGRDSTPSLSQRHQLPYTDAFLQEVMRYWPLVGYVPRRCNDDFELDGYCFAKGTQVMLSTYRCSYDEQVFPQPDEFQPERFLDENGKLAAYKRGFVPFGAGTRVCLGESIAKKTIFLLTVLLIQNFRFEINPGDELLPTISERSNMFMILPNRFQVRVIRRSA